MLNVFSSNAFSFTSLTDAILKAPFVPGRIGKLGLFREKGITTTTVTVEEKDGRLTLIQSAPRGAVPTHIGSKKRTARLFQATHLARESNIYADEVQGVRAFGSENATDTVEALVRDRLADLRVAHEVTLEHLRIGALKGLILDADGSTIYNLFTEFNVSQQMGVLTPDAAADGGDSMRNDVVALQRLIENELGGEPIQGYAAFCGAHFFDRLRSDLSITKTLRFADPASLLQQEANIRRFQFAGVNWEEYRGSTGVVDGVAGTPFVADTEAYLFPLGTSIFTTYFAPADFIETVNTMGLPMYAKLVNDDELNQFVRLHTQSNPLALCLRPRGVVKVTLST